MLLGPRPAVGPRSPPPSWDLPVRDPDDYRIEIIERP
jgi:hypothetical protein